MDMQNAEGAVDPAMLGPPVPPDPRFTLELEFVLSLGNPNYLSHLAVSYPHLLGTREQDLPAQDADADTLKEGEQTKTEADGPKTSSNNEKQTEDAAAFAAYLKYLYEYWQRPEYMQFLTHPEASLKSLRLLQEEEFRRIVISPAVTQTLMEK
ncbi:suppressor of hpr1 [Ascosphaera pollenicola]|nr:suppressor of hpr1 [Ascosphaera pollenicola]